MARGERVSTEPNKISDDSKDILQYDLGTKYFMVIC